MDLADIDSLQNTEDRGSLCPVAVVVRKQPKRSGFVAVKGRGSTSDCCFLFFVCVCGVVGIYQDLPWAIHGVEPVQI